MIRAVVSLEKGPQSHPTVPVGSGPHGGAAGHQHPEYLRPETDAEQEKVVQVVHHHPLKGLRSEGEPVGRNVGHHLGQEIGRVVDGFRSGARPAPTAPGRSKVKRKRAAGWPRRYEQTPVVFQRTQEPSNECHLLRSLQGAIEGVQEIGIWWPGCPTPRLVVLVDPRVWPGSLRSAGRLKVTASKGAGH